MNALRGWLVAPALALGLIAIAVPAWPFTARVVVILGALVSLIAALRALNERIVRPLGAVANVLEGLRRGEHNLRVRGPSGTPLADVHAELNALAETIQAHRLTDHESAALLAAVLRELDAAVLAFDRRGCLRLLNPAAEALLGCSQAKAVGRTASELGVEAWLAPEDPSASTDDALKGPFSLRRTPFRRGGEPHELVVVTHLGGALRSEERQAWQRLLRVLSHEINNSLSPIITVTGAHKKVIDQGKVDVATLSDLAEGLDVIGRRAASLRSFLASFARLTRLPPPTHAPFSASSSIRRVAALETRVRVDVDGPGDPTLVGDRDQLEQMLQNLVHNAADAALAGGGHASVRWDVTASSLIIDIDDDGPGVASQANLFVPFFTTKPDGSGIGLVLARAIAEGHGGTVDLGPRHGGGCRARVVLPLDGETSTKGATTRASLPRRVERRPP